MLTTPAIFCYVCGKFYLQKQRKNIKKFVINTYEGYFGRKIAQKKHWVPNTTCMPCEEFLRYWGQGRRKLLQF